MTQDGTRQFIADLRSQARLAAVKGDEYAAYFHDAAADRLSAAEDVVDAARVLRYSDEESAFEGFDEALARHDSVSKED